MRPPATAIVIGASSGIGEGLVRTLAGRGVRVAAVARRTGELERIAADLPGRVLPLTHDVRDYEHAPALFARIVAELGGCDLFIYNAGIMHRVAEDEFDFSKDREMLEVNLVGAVRWLDLAAVHMSQARSGTICGISSVAGDRGRRLNPAYHTSKAGLTTFLESLRNRLSRLGITVVTVKPGPVRTAMTEGLKLPLLIDVDEAVRGTLALIDAGATDGYVPAAWGPIMGVIRRIPSVVFRRLNV